MTSIRRFCEDRKISPSIESAFTSYCKTSYALQFELKEGDTVSKIVSNLTDEQILDAWNKFIVELKDALIESLNSKNSK